MDFGLLVARLTFGTLMAAHGSQKLFGWLDGRGLTGTAAFFDALGFRPGRVFAVTAAASEVAGGVLVTLGLLGPVGAALMVAVMIVALASVHWRNGLFALSNGIELPLLYGAGAFALALTGPGVYSVDTLLGLTQLWTPGMTVGILAIGVLAGLLNLALRRPIRRASAA